MIENVLLFLAWLSNRERCPYCVGTGRDGDHLGWCPTLDTCGQFGPPWVLDVLHPDDPLHPRKQPLEALADFYERCDEWNAKRREHLRDDHGFVRAA